MQEVVRVVVWCAGGGEGGGVVWRNGGKGGGVGCGHTWVAFE